MFGLTWDDDGGDRRIDPRIRGYGFDVAQPDDLRGVSCGVDRQRRHSFLEVLQNKGRV
jgi:hypothetical protein